MEPAAFLGASRVLIVAGKGGVGKTTVSAAVARLASSVGMRTLVVEIEGKSGLSPLFGRSGSLSYSEVELLAASDAEGGVSARTLTPDDALLDYLIDHGLKRVSKRLASSGALDVVATAVPGLRDILVLGKVKSLEKGADADLIVVDAPAAGHAVTFLTSAKGLLDAFRVGPVRTQAAEVAELLSDPARCQVMLVTLPEETPVNEMIETAFKIEDRVGVSLAPVVVNSIYPVLEGLVEGDAGAGGGGRAAEGGGGLAVGAGGLAEAGRFRHARQELQAAQMARLAEALPLPQLHLPYLFSTDLGRVEVDQLAAALAAGIEALPDHQGARP
ncbi:MAG TPA: ArsA-related P-loop ATPase [Acidimicrobiales bacterium]|nr:ArsA-related P-loop ATPase [Acidimicrobiales bacterium]